LPVYSYDKEADVLYISFSPGEKATTAVELNDNFLLRFNRAEKRVIGVLKISTYTPFSAEAVPITSVEMPPFAIAA